MSLQSTVSDSTKSSNPILSLDGVTGYDCIDQTLVPVVARKKIRTQSILNGMPDSPESREFESYFRICFSEGDTIYVTTQQKRYADETNANMIYLVDVLNGETVRGFSEVTFSIETTDERFLRKPSVGYTQTNEGHLLQGLAKRRLRVMNALSNIHFSTPLYSDTVSCDASEHMWESLMETGEATGFLEDLDPRYKFLK